MDEPKNPVPPHTCLSLSDPKIAAAALATGGRLSRIDVAPGGRLTFLIVGVPDDLLTRIVNDQVTVSVKSYIAAMESVLAMIAEHQRRRGSR